MTMIRRNNNISKQQRRRRIQQCALCIVFVLFIFALDYREAVFLSDTTKNNKNNNFLLFETKQDASNTRDDNNDSHHYNQDSSSSSLLTRQNTTQESTIQEKSSKETKEDRRNSIQNELLQNILNSDPAMQSLCQDKAYFLNLFVPSLSKRLNADTIKQLCTQLPTFTQMIEKWGPKPVVVGLETCQQYQKQQSHSMPRVAGLYNTGTNALERIMHDNFELLKKISAHDPHRVPWGKHLPPNRHRLSNKTPGNNPENPQEILPIIMVRDPFFWLQSMCKHSYEVRWGPIKPQTLLQSGNDPCPQLQYKNGTIIPAWAKTEQTRYKLTDHYTSLIHMWEEWHQEYLNADFPRLFIRFEDILYRAQEVYEIIEPCFNFGNNTDNRRNDRLDFILQTTAAKKHGKPTELTASLAKYVTTSTRYRGLTLRDRQFILKSLNHTVTRDLFHYSLDVPTDAASIEKDLQPPYPKKLKWM